MASVLENLEETRLDRADQKEDGKRIPLLRSMIREQDGNFADWVHGGEITLAKEEKAIAKRSVENVEPCSHLTGVLHTSWLNNLKKILRTLFTNLHILTNLYNLHWA